MRCPECQAEGERSTVTGGPDMTYPIGAQAFWDEDGKHHHHDASTTVYYYRCSRGHDWEERTGGSCWCGWSSEPYWPARKVEDAPG